MPAPKFLLPALVVGVVAAMFSAKAYEDKKYQLPPDSRWIWGVQGTTSGNEKMDEYFPLFVPTLYVENLTTGVPTLPEAGTPEYAETGGQLKRPAEVVEFLAKAWANRLTGPIQISRGPLFQADAEALSEAIQARLGYTGITIVS